MRAMVPMRDTVPFTSCTMLDVAASRNSTVSLVTRVTSSPVLNRCTCSSFAMKNRLMSECLASNTIRSASFPRRTDWAKPATVPIRSSPMSSMIGRARLTPVSSESSTHFVASGVASIVAVAKSPRSTPAASFERCGRE